MVKVRGQGGSASVVVESNEFESKSESESSRPESESKSESIWSEFKSESSGSESESSGSESEYESKYSWLISDLGIYVAREPKMPTLRNVITKIYQH